MNTQLHKTQQGFIVTSGDKIGEKDLILWDGKVKTAIDTSYSYPTQKVIAQQHQLDFSAISEEWCKRIGWFDLIDYSEEISSLLYNEEAFSNKVFKSLLAVAVQEGFQKAQELLSDRVFTLEDMKRFGAFMQQRHTGIDESLDKFIQSLTPTTWEITGEFVGDKYRITEIK